VDEITQWVIDASGSPWVLPIVALLTILDAFLVIVPSETVVVALATLSVSSGTPNLVLLIIVAAIAAMIGDSLTFALGRRLGTPMLARVRSSRVQSVFAWARTALDRRAALVIFIARYIPYGRVAVNLVAGSTGFAYRRYLPLSALACTAWAIYNVALGATVGAWLGDNPILAVVVSVVLAIAIGLLIDAIRVRRERRHDAE
jgi:membrane protein DedA with SNARE-associated domain